MVRQRLLLGVSSPPGNIVIVLVMASPVLPACEFEAPLGGRKHPPARLLKTVDQCLGFGFDLIKTLPRRDQRGLPEPISQICEFTGEGGVVLDRRFHPRSPVRWWNYRCEEYENRRRGRGTLGYNLPGCKRSKNHRCNGTKRPYPGKASEPNGESYRRVTAIFRLSIALVGECSLGIAHDTSTGTALPKISRHPPPARAS